MKREFTVITPTGDRPKPFELCKFYISRQTIQPSQWIIIDDGKVPFAPPDFAFVDYIRREPQPTDRPHTLPIQMLKALEYVKYDKVFIIEDDDWYAPNYFEKMLPLFEHPSRPELVGQGQAVYYHIALKKYYFHNNTNRASWCQTGFRKSLIPQIQKLCREGRDSFLDSRVWRLNIKKNLLLEAKPLCVGIKGLPGRQGTGMGWKRPYLFTPDRHLKTFYKFVGEDIKLYKGFTK